MRRNTVAFDLLRRRVLAVTEDWLTELLPCYRMIDVAICTFRRLSLEETLRSIAEQALPDRVRVRVLVADNDTLPSARARVVEAAIRFNLEYLYVHAPERNISLARNACLEHATASLLAFIDDDEVATPGWLATLLARMDDTGADIVLGPAIAQYPELARAWVRTADMHTTRPVAKNGGRFLTGYTSNVMMRRPVFDIRRFDLALGRSGGEDDVFFSGAVRDGATIAYAEDAIVYDPVPLSRANLHWLARRSFRNGQTHASIAMAAGNNRLWGCIETSTKAAFCFGVAALSLPWGARWRKSFIRGTLHLGACARYWGWKEIRLY